MPNSSYGIRTVLWGVWIATAPYKRTTRLRAAFHVLRGRPLAYRLKMEPGTAGLNLRSESENVHIVDCDYRG